MFPHTVFIFKATYLFSWTAFRDYWLSGWPMCISVLRIMLAPVNSHLLFLTLLNNNLILYYFTLNAQHYFYINNCTKIVRSKKSQKQIPGISRHAKYFSPSHSSPLLIIRAPQTDAALFTDGWDAGQVAHGSSLPSSLSTDYSSYTFPVMPELHSLQGKAIEWYR